MQRHGLIVADNGSDRFVTGAPSRRCKDGAPLLLESVRGRDYEVVDVTSLR